MVEFPPCLLKLSVERTTLSCTFFQYLAGLCQLWYPIPAVFKPVRWKGVESVLLVDHQGFSYSKSAVRKDQTSYWRCSQKMTSKCRAVAYLKEDIIVGLNYEHNHGPTQT